MIIVADNIRITNPEVEQALNDLDPAPIQALTKQCEAAGAEAIDINSGPLGQDPEKKMTFLVESIQAITRLPVLIDTTHPKAIESGLRAGRKPVMINGFSLEPARLQSILPLAVKYDADIIGYLLYPNGHVPSDGAGRLDVALKLYAEVQKAGLKDDQLIIDPIVAPLMWEDGRFQAMEILSVIRTLPDLLGFPVKTISGLSNLGAGNVEVRKKQLMEQAYAAMLSEAGLSMILMDVFHEGTMGIVSACNALKGSRIFSWEEV